MHAGHFSYLLNGSRSSGVKLASDTLRLLANTAARRYLEDGSPLDRTIQKIASERELNPHQIERVCEMANLATHKALWEKTAQKDKVAFPLANAKNVIRVVSNPGVEGIAPVSAPLAAPACGVDSDYNMPPQGIPSPATEMPPPSNPGHDGLFNDDEKKRILIVIEKKAAERSRVKDALVYQTMQLRDLEKKAFSTVKQCVIRGESFRSLFAKAAAANLRKTAAKYFPEFQDKLIQDSHGDLQRRLVKTAISRAPEELISSNMGNTTVVNGAHPVLISLDTIQRKTGEVKNGLHNLLRIDDEVRILHQRVRELS